MMRFPVAVSLAVIAFLGSGLGRAEEISYLATIGNVSVPEHNAIISFELALEAGAISGVENLPIGWTYSIDNDASWKTKIQAAVSIGSAAISPSDLKNIRIKVIKNEFGDLKFHISGNFYYTEDFSNQKKMELGKGQIILKQEK